MVRLAYLRLKQFRFRTACHQHQLADATNRYRVGPCEGQSSYEQRHPMVNEESENQEREAARYEDLRSIANRTMWTISLQIRRLRAFTEDLDAGSEFVLQWVSDAEFLILSLDRFLAVSRRIEPMTGDSLRGAIGDYERELPNLRAARNVVSHMDEYLSGQGQNSFVRVGTLSVVVLDSDLLTFASFNFNLGSVQTVAEALFAAIRSTSPPSREKRRNEG